MSADPSREMAIFTGAVGLAVEQRIAFLDRVCGGDEPLRRKVLALLQAHERVGDFLANPAFEARSQAGADSQTRDRKGGQDAIEGESK